MNTSLLRTRALLVACLLTCAILLGGCFGKFALTGKVYNWNKGVSSNVFVQSAVAWGLLIIPVYEVVFIADWLVLNPIAALTGSELVQNGRDGSLQTDYAGHAYKITPRGERFVSIERDGELVGFGEQLKDGGIRAVDANGKVLAALSPEDLGRTAK